MLFLQSHDVSTAHATKIYKTYGEKSVEIVRENPYQLADDIWGIGFKTADTIAAKLGFEHEKHVRLRSGLIYTLNRLSDDGHCYATREQLLQTGMELLTVSQEKLSESLEKMIAREDVIIEEERIYLPPFYHSEVGTAKRLFDIFHDSNGIQIDFKNRPA